VSKIVCSASCSIRHMIIASCMCEDAFDVRIRAQHDKAVDRMMTSMVASCVWFRRGEVTVPPNQGKLLPWLQRHVGL
jgi:hypothetical protein